MRRLARALGGRLATLAPLRVDLQVDLLNLALSAGDEKGATERIAKLHELEGESGPNWRCGEVSLQLQFAPAGDRSWLADAGPRPRKPLAVGRIGRCPRCCWAKSTSGSATPTPPLRATARRWNSASARQESCAGPCNCCKPGTALTKAQELLRKLQNAGPTDNELERAITGSLVGRAKPDDLLEKARQLAPADSKDYRDHLWLAHVLNALGERAAEAGREYRRAVELGPEAAEAWVGLVFFLAGQNDKAAAVAACDQASAKLHGPAAVAPSRSAGKPLARPIEPKLC